MSHLIGYGFLIIVTVLLVQRLDYGLDEIRSTSYVVWANSGKLFSGGSSSLFVLNNIVCALSLHNFV